MGYLLPENSVIPAEMLIDLAVSWIVGVLKVFFPKRFYFSDTLKTEFDSCIFTSAKSNANMVREATYQEMLQINWA